MIKFLSSAFLLLLTFTNVAQNKTISLEDAVLQQNRLFRADKMLGFQWIPNSDSYIHYTDNWTKMKIVSQTDKSEKEFVLLNDINSALKINLKSFFGIQFIDNTSLLISDKTNFYKYNTATKTGFLITEVPLNAKNPLFDNANNTIAFTIKNNVYIKNGSNKNVAITANDNSNIVSGQAIARSEFGISEGLFWSSKNSYLAFYQKDETNVADYPLLDINETPGKLENIKYPMIGQSSENPKVGIYNVATQKTVFISPKGNAEDYLTNFTFTPDEKLVLIAEVNRAQNKMDLNLYESNTGNFVKTLFSETNDKWVEPENPAFFPNPASNNFVWVSERNGYNNLYYYTIDGNLVKQLTNNTFPVNKIISSNNKGTEIYFSATGENPTNMLAYKVDLKGKQTLITKDFGVHTVVPNYNGNFFFDEFSNHTTPSKSLIYNKKLVSKVLLESKNKYEGYTLGTSEVKTILAPDGTTNLYTRLIKPSNFDPNKKYPVLVYVYGGPHAQMITNSFLDGANLWMYWMAEQGYLVFTLDNRGSSNRGFAFESVIHRNLGINEMDDQEKGIDYLKSLPFVDVNRLAVHGWSYGGFMTTSLMLRKPDIFKVGIAGGPVTDWKYYEIMYGERYMDTPSENQKGFDVANTLNYVKNLQGKLLLIHGTSDDVVVMQHNLALVKKFIEAEKQIDFFPYPMHKHNVAGKDRVHLMKKVLDYVLENNK